MPAGTPAPHRALSMLVSFQPVTPSRAPVLHTVLPLSLSVLGEGKELPPPWSPSLLPCPLHASVPGPWSGKNASVPWAAQGQSRAAWTMCPGPATCCTGPLKCQVWRLLDGEVLTAWGWPWGLGGD